MIDSNVQKRLLTNIWNFESSIFIKRSIFLFAWYENAKGMF